MASEATGSPPQGLPGIWHSGRGPRPTWLAGFWGWRATGIEFQPNVRLWGVGFGRVFLGIAVADAPR